MTRKIAVLFAVMGLMVMAFAGVALTVTKVGDAGPNRLVGTAENDTLRGRGGADKLIGRGDSDQLFGGRTFDDNPDADDRGFNDRGLDDNPTGADDVMASPTASASAASGTASAASASATGTATATSEAGEDDGRRRPSARCCQAQEVRPWWH